MIAVGQVMETLDRAAGQNNTNHFLIYHLIDWKNRKKAGWYKDENFGFPFESGSRKEISKNTKKLIVRKIIADYRDQFDEPSFGSFNLIVD